jgi:hypothetical protein
VEEVIEQGPRLSAGLLDLNIIEIEAVCTREGRERRERERREEKGGEGRVRDQGESGCQMFFFSIKFLF